MTKNQWKKKIIESCEAAGTYKPFFDDVIISLADILEKRDKVNKQFKESGGNAVIVHVNKAQAKNFVKNPLLVVIGELNTQALAYWRDLGLTPAGLKKLEPEALKTKKNNSFGEFLMGRIDK